LTSINPSDRFVGVVESDSALIDFGKLSHAPVGHTHGGGRRADFSKLSRAAQRVMAARRLKGRESVEYAEMVTSFTRLMAIMPDSEKLAMTGMMCRSWRVPFDVDGRWAAPPTAAGPGGSINPAMSMSAGAAVSDAAGNFDGGGIDSYGEERLCALLAKMAKMAAVETGIAMAHERSAESMLVRSANTVEHVSVNPQKQTEGMGVTFIPKSTQCCVLCIRCIYERQEVLYRTDVFIDGHGSV
jgi:hypothetical protein